MYEFIQSEWGCIPTVRLGIILTINSNGETSRFFEGKKISMNSEIKLI